jgi:molecular chaperone HscB
MVSVDLTRNFFDVFDIPVSFEIDIEQLSTKYRRLQHAVHPDKFANGTDQEKALSAQQSAMINDAFQTLKSPLSRSRYLLEMLGVEFSDNQTSMDSDFLMQQMELREAIAETKHSQDPYAHTVKLANEIQVLTRSVLQTMSELFSKINWQAADSMAVDGHSIDKNVLDKLVNYSNRLQFMYRLADEVQQLEEELT